MSKKENKIKGNYGENLACKYIKDKGYEILSRNFNCSYGEIDIIAEKDGYIVFVEVKTRAANSLYSPAEAVTASKQRKIITTAQHYLLQSQSKLQPRFDVFEVVTASKNDFRVIKSEHIENAFGA